MLEGLISLASYNYYGGEIGNILSQAEQMGVFSYLLPFLLIFAIVNGILSITRLFDSNKSISPIISLTVSLMALQFEFVPRFFAEIFPRLGVGLAIILVLILIMGLFSPGKEAWFGYIIFGVGTIILITILVQTAGALGWSAGFWWYDNWARVAFWVGFGVIILAILNINKSSSSAETIFSNFLKNAMEPIK
ncbi:MAG: hypothetical protein QF567_00860 [Candidatus Pacearchaeota archaeon]|jgi:hypothetical protein|nr:hypothetical protein [Candidatus Pacearchaeota archaeon]|tara:strand:- start:5215 stop:5790 length:576 start_codon:yes stop_codon:yes gene_type:complete